jgi:transposase
VVRRAGGRTTAQVGARRGGRLCANRHGLVRFLDDGRIEIASNAVERSMQPIALNRKNALFAGHDLGAENWAVLASLTETCKLHGVNPEAWLAEVITRLVDNWPNSRLAELTPWAWQAAQNSRAAA